MAKLILQPQFGTIVDSQKVKYTIDGLETLSDGEQYRIDFENTTFACKINSDGEYLDLNIPPHSSQSAISVFANIFIVSDGEELLKEICPAIFNIQNTIVNKFKGELQVSPIFASPKDLCNIKISKCKPDTRTIFSINDRRLSVMSNLDGDGSIHFVGKDMLDKEATSIQKMPIYFYSEDDNYVRKNFTGSYINLLPQEIATFSDANVDPRCTDVDYVPGSWNVADDAPQECFSVDDPGSSDDTPVDIVVGAVDIPTSLQCDGAAIPVSDGGCRINSYSVAMLNNGRVVYAYTNIDNSITDTDSQFYNKNKVILVDNNTSVTVPIIADIDAAIAPKTVSGDFNIYVEKKVYDALSDVENNPSAADIHVLFYDESIGYQSAEVIGRSTDWIIDPAHPSAEGEGLYYIIIAKDENIRATIKDWMFCVNMAFYNRAANSESIINENSDINNALGYVGDAFGNILQVNNISVSSNKKYLSTYDESFIYLISEAFVDGNSQLFFASGVVGEDYEASVAGDKYFGWKQITFSGNNINPRSYVDDTNTLHVFWESDRSGSWKVYYGCLGLANESMTNSVFASMVDKQVEMFEDSNKSSHYLSQNLLEDKTIDDPSNPIPSSLFSDILTSTEWQTTSDENGVVTTSSNTGYLDSVQITANAVADEAIAFLQVPIYDIEQGLDDSLPYSQINYQVSFELTTTLTQSSRLLFDVDNPWHNTVLDEKSVDNLFKSWKSEFSEDVDNSMSNVPAYSKDGNLFVIGRQDSIFDNVVPFYGAYDTLSSQGDPSNDIVNFKAKILKDNNTLKDFMLGFMFEKSRFKATNIRSIDEHNLVSDNEYVLEEEHIIFTGRAKLIAFVKTEDDNIERSNYCILREFPDVFNVIGTNFYEIIANYTKIDSDEVANVLDSFSDEYDNRFAGRVTLLIDGDAKFSQAFVSELSYDNTYFDVGLGIPFGGYLVSDKMTPSTSGLFDNISVNMSYNNINISSPTYSYNPDVVYLPASITDMTTFRVDDLSSDPSTLFEYSLLNLGIRDYENLFSQIPISMDGICKSPSITYGNCNDAHLVWQSNLSNYWDVYYSNATDKIRPFRFDTRITDTKSNSVMPAVSVNKNGKRMIVWHDNRNGSFDIYSARSLEGYSCTQSSCQNKMTQAFTEEISQCSLSFDYEVTEAGFYEFSINFYNDSGLNNIFKIISSGDDSTGWFVDGAAFDGLLSYSANEVLGIQLNAEDMITVSYIPGKEDGIFDKVLYTTLVDTMV